MMIKQYLEFLSLKGGCIGSSESIHVKMPHCWKSHAMAHFSFSFQFFDSPVLYLESVTPRPSPGEGLEMIN